jgi:flagellar hook capping protein FlgD
MPLRRQYGSLLAGLIATLVLIVAAAPARAAIETPPGGPILVVTSSGDPFGQYYTEILRNEGFNDFDVADVSQLHSGLADHDTVILAKTSLTDAQVTSLTTWVQSGGNLIAMRPDKKLAPLLGLSDTGAILSNADLKVDTSQAPGKGITSSVMQFHDAADRYALAGARGVAALYSDSSTPTASPAVSLRNVGLGHAAAFTYDLARSIVATRQGNIAWAGQNRDYNAFSQSDPDPVIRSNDLFFGGALPDWVDLNRVAVPQADEQQRLLANLIEQGSYTPTPKLWYLPRGEKAVIALTGDDHGSGRTEDDVFQKLLDVGPAGCDVDPVTNKVVDEALVATWDCPRATSYIVPETIITNAAAVNWTSYGFEIAPHPRFDPTGSCLDFQNLADLNAKLDSELGKFALKYPGLVGPTAPRTIRTHCVPWSDWSSQAKADASHGIRLNTDYYYFSADWTNNRPGMFTGSGMPMRFADGDGSLIDVYQATTYGADDATRKKGQPDDPLTDPNAVVPIEGKALMDGALGPEGFYGAFTMQVHSDAPANSPARDALVADAMSRGVPIISERQLLTWLDGRNSSTFEAVEFGTDGKLRFTVVPGAGANGLQAMIPIQGRSGELSALKRDGQPVGYDTQTIKGVEYAILPDAGGDYVASYPAPTAPHPTPGGGGNTGGGSTGAGSTGAAATGPSSAASKPTKALPFVSASAASFRPGAKRTFVLTVRLKSAARIVLTLRDRKGKVVRTIRVPKQKAGTVRVRWDGKDSRGRYVKAAKYGYTVTAIGSRYKKTAKGSLRVLTAR